MERIRVLERHCLRACLGKYRKYNTIEKHYIANNKIYNFAKINRIDLFMIKQIRNHFARSSLSSNSLIRGPTILQTEYIEKTLDSGFIPPEGFIYLDATGRIQDSNNIPILYHIYRRATDRSVKYECNINIENIADRLRFDIKGSNKDKKDFKNLNRKIYWWLDCTFSPN